MAMQTGAAHAQWPCLSMHGDVPWLELSVSPSARLGRRRVRPGQLNAPVANAGAPGSSAQAEGLHDGALRVRLAAPPVDGKANALLVAWVAAELGLPRRAVRLVRGESSRRKWLAVDAPEARVACWLQGLLGAKA